MKLGVRRKFWAKFQEFSKSLAIFIKYPNFKTALDPLNFNSDSNSNLGKFQ
jgi:hypothetical protein